MNPYAPILVVLLLVSTSFLGMSYIADELLTISFDGNTLYVGGSGEGNYTIIQDAHRTILFGGNKVDGQYNDTWVYNFSDNRWCNVSYSVVGGSLYRRECAGMIYDSNHKKTIFWGSFTNDHPPGQEDLNDTWTFKYNIGNKPPNPPTNPEPANGSLYVDPDADLSWYCWDPDYDDLTYDVYFEANDPTPDELASDNQSETSYDPGTMEYNETYYWQIIAWEPLGNNTAGPVWHFTTEGPNNPPYTPSNPNPVDEEIVADPVNSNPSPGNGETGVLAPPSNFSIYVSDPDENHTLTVTFHTNESGVWQDAQTNSSVSNPSFVYLTNKSWVDSYSTTYWWSVNTTDSNGGWDNDTYSFTTKEEYLIDGNGIQEYLNKPCSIHYQCIYNRTYFVYTNSNGKILIRYYDHENNIFSNETELDDEYDDDHHAPTMAINGTGHIFLFYIDDYDGHVGDIMLRTSVNPEDISSWNSETTVDSGSHTYPKPWINASGAIWLTYRDKAPIPDNTIISYSTDNGSSWNTATFLSGATYMQQYQEEQNPNYIHVTCTDGDATESRENIYYIYSDDGGNTWKNSSGDTLSVPISFSEMTIAWQASTIRQLDVFSDDAHNAHILANRNINWANETIPVYHIWYDGITWQNEKLPFNQDTFRAEGEVNAYTNGGCFDRKNADIIYVGVKNGTGDNSDVLMYAKYNGIWNIVYNVTSGGNGCKVRPMPIENYIDNMSFTYANGTYTGPNDFNTTLYYGERRNVIPTQTNPYPANQSTDIPIIPALNVTVDDPNNDTLTSYWYSNYSQYRKYRTITVDSTYIDATLTNFPLLVVLDNCSGDYTFHNSGTDIEFISTDNITQFNHEIELFNNSGKTYCWVGINETISNSNDYNFPVYYNNSGDTTVHKNPTGVWDSHYLGVYHMNNASGGIVDKTPIYVSGTEIGDLETNLSWTGGDPDPGDTVNYDVYFEAGDSTPDVKVSSNQTDTTYDPGTLSINTQYYWRIIAWDNHDASTEGPIWCFSTITNDPPNTPNNPEPEDGATDVDINANLSWECSDPNDNNLTYDVYFEIMDPTPDVLVSNNQSETTYDPGTMHYNTHYYWKIVAWDPYNFTEGSVWDFTTGANPNNLPYVPSDPDPENDSTNVDIDSDLSWVGGDPDDDPVVYDVYFEAYDQTPDDKVADDITETTFDPGTLEYDTIYYWRIIAKDSHGASTWGPVWHFTTPIPDLACEGSLSWTDIKPGKTVNGDFTVSNSGDSLSLLDWEITEYPSWGSNWVFSPISYDDLKPGDGPITVSITLTAPDEKNSEFDGEIKIVNQENPTDFCTIDASLTTPKNKAFNFYVNVLTWLFERFPNVFSVLRYLIGF